MQAPWVSISPYEPYLRSHIEEAAKLQVSDSLYVSRMDLYVVSVHGGLVVPMPVNLCVSVRVCHCVVRRMAFSISVFVCLSLARTLTGL